MKNAGSTSFILANRHSRASDMSITARMLGSSWYVSPFFVARDVYQSGWSRRSLVGADSMWSVGSPFLTVA